jgi:hypothetical protein
MLAKNPKRRFNLDNKSYIIDNLNPQNSGKYYYPDAKESDFEFRRHILWGRLEDLVRKLIVGPNARKIRNSLVEMLIAVIEVSQLNTLDPLMSIQHPFKDKLHRKQEIRDYTSLMLFIRDVERVLRDLYGDLGEVDRAVYAISQIVRNVIAFVRPDLAAEYDDADNAETIYYRCLRTDMRDGEDASSSEAGVVSISAMVLAVRSLQVKSDPSRYCHYTLKFVKALDKYWPDLGGIKRLPRIEAVIYDET